MALIEMISCCDDFARSGIVIQPLPSGTIRGASARRTGVAPDLSVVVQLIELSAGGNDRCSPRIVVQLLPARTRVAATRRSCVTPDRTIRVKLENLVCSRDDALRIRVIVE